LTNEKMHVLFDFLSLVYHAQCNDLQFHPLSCK
jgi:hypothetical protein